MHAHQLYVNVEGPDVEGLACAVLNQLQSLLTLFIVLTKHVLLQLVRDVALSAEAWWSDKCKSRRQVSQQHLRFVQLGSLATWFLLLY